MASAYSQDSRDRVIEAVIGGKMSRRGAAARFGVSLSSAIKWVQRFRGPARAGPREWATITG
jgi:transposase